MRSSPPCPRVLALISAVAAIALPAQTPAGPPPLDARLPRQTAESEAAASFATGRARLQDGDYDAAIAALSRAVASRPDDVEYRLALAQACVAAERYPQAEAVLQRALTRFPEHVGLRLGWIDVALAQGRYAIALERLKAAGASARESAAFRLRTAQAYFHRGLVLGEAEVRTVPGGRPGQFVGERLLVEQRPGPNRFLCCPKESALYQLRQALDAGLDEPAAHVLHARIWQQLGRPQIGLAVLKARAAVLLVEPEEGVLKAFCDLALEAGALSDYLRFERKRAERHPARREAILFEACLTAAERYSQRGDETLYVQWLHRAAQFRPDDSDALLRLADAEWSTGHSERASSLYRRLLRLDPGHSQRGRILALLAECESRRAP